MGTKVAVSGIGVAVAVESSPLSLVGGNRKEKNEERVGVGVREAPEIGMSAKLSVGVGTRGDICVSRSTILVGANSAIKLTASAAAVAFMLAKDTSSVLRD